MQHVYCLDNDDNFFLGSIFWLQYIKRLRKRYLFFGIWCVSLEQVTEQNVRLFFLQETDL